jgi:ring-1,2-phenylacetyl-CoA epoxidase subunit PaaC
MVELVAAYPELEEELANANFALDYIGQARMFYTCAGELEGQGRSDDDFAFLRDENEFRNLLLLEQPNGHFGDSITKLVLFELFYFAQLRALTGCEDARVAEIAARAEKEIRYHLRHNTEADEIDTIVERAWGGPNLEKLHKRWLADIDAILINATLDKPEDGWMASGGKAGRHTEHFGYLLAEMQYLQRSHPGASW